MTLFFAANSIRLQFVTRSTCALIGISSWNANLLTSMTITWSGRRWRRRRTRATGPQVLMDLVTVELKRSESVSGDNKVRDIPG